MSPPSGSLRVRCIRDGCACKKNGSEMRLLSEMPAHIQADPALYDWQVVVDG